MKKVLLYIFLFCTVIWLMTAALVCAASIPTASIQKKAEESASYLMRKNVHFYNVFGEESVLGEVRYGDCSKVDQIADAKLLSIAYYLDQDHPLESVLTDRYYYKSDTEKTMNESFARSVKEDLEPNNQYLRYWHGSLIFVRPLLLFLNLREMKIFHGMVIALLLIVLLAMLIRRSYKTEAVCLSISMGIVSIWFVPLSLEYTWMFLLTLVISGIAVRFSDSPEKEERIFLLFFLTGMFTSYLDFLTTETLTLLIPLLLLARICRRNALDSYNLVWRSVFLWGIGYIAAWVSKWGLVFLILGVNPVPYIRWNFFAHFGTYDNMNAIQQIIEAFQRNLLMLFPFGYGTAGCIGFSVLLVAGIVTARKKGIAFRKNVNIRQILLYVLLGSVVYIRYIVIRHHGWFHYFFTYRAQASVILAVCFIIPELLEIRKVKPT